MIEISAPAGSYSSLQAALHAKADSIYFGIFPLNMRARAADPFTLKDLSKISSLCKREKTKTYLVLNTILYDNDLALMKKICHKAKECEISAVVASDMAAILYARSLGLSVHASTQLNVSNLDSLRFFSQFVDVCVLARELSLSQITSLCHAIRKEKICGPSGKLLQIELFAHGALCVAISGKCYMSLALYNHSANRGDCLQACRHQYRLVDDETEEALLVDNSYIMSPKDLCTIGMLDQMVSAGVSILKIEGRGRSAEYVSTTVQVYKEALTAIENKTYSPEKATLWRQELQKVYNRGFWENGYYLGKKLGEWSNCAGSKAKEKKVWIGTVAHYFGKSNICEARITKDRLKCKDQVLIIGKTTGAVRSSIESLRIHSSLEESKITVTFPLSTKVRKNDQIYLVEER